MRRASILAALVAVAGMNADIEARAAPLNGPAAAALDAELQAVVATPGRELASLSVLAIRNGEVVYHRQFGHKWLDLANPANSKPADAATVYRIASITKLVITLGIMRLVENGKLDLERDASEYVGFPLRNPNFPDVPVTIAQMLSHTASLRDDGGYYWDANSNAQLKEVFVPGGRLHGEGKMWAKNAKPGAYFQYANVSWTLVAQAIERATGERFDRAMKRLVLDPLKLAGGFHPADFNAAELANVATLYRKRKEIDGKEVWNTAGPWIPQTDDYSRDAPLPRAKPDYVIGTNGSLFGPAGNCRLSAAGLARIAMMLMNGGQIDGQRFLAAASVDKMLATRWKHDGMGLNGNSNGEIGFGSHREYMNEWGLGNQHFIDKSGPGRGDRLVEGGGFLAVGHLGDAWGLTSALVFDRASKNALIFLTGGPAADPDTYPGQYSSFYRHEERIMTALHRHAIAGK